MYSDVRTYLLEHGVHPSLQRIAVMHYLCTHPVHPTADEVYNALSKEMPTLSKTTVYNTLKLLAEKKAILMLTIDEKNIRYDADTHPHAHFICLGCGCVKDIELEEMDMVRIPHYQDLQIVETQVYYRGYCAECQKNNLLNSKKQEK